MKCCQKALLMSFLKLISAEGSTLLFTLTLKTSQEDKRNTASCGSRYAKREMMARS
jgi:hypothetical protein